MQRIVASARTDLTAANKEMIIHANSPFEWIPSHLKSAYENKKKLKNGILLIHGLFDSPFTQMDLGNYFFSRDFLVRTLLLPGHGTVPGDLLTIRHQEWMEAIEFGINSLKDVVENIYVLGFSLGGTLTILTALKHADIKALFLVAPAIKPHAKIAPLLHLYKYAAWLSPSLNWYRIRPQTNYARYESLACNAAVQAYELIRLTNRQLTDKVIDIPMFVVASDDDETVASNAIIKFFTQQPQKKNKLLFYSNRQLSEQDSRIEIRNSYYPQKKILDFSHICLPIAPTNPYFGYNGSYKDFQHYANLQPPPNKSLRLGAITKNNLHRYAIQRITYNADFAGMTQKLGEFLDKIEQ